VVEPGSVDSHPESVAKLLEHEPIGDDLHVQVSLKRDEWHQGLDESLQIQLSNTKHSMLQPTQQRDLDHQT
jgi:hypothetical protein